MTKPFFATPRESNRQIGNGQGLAKGLFKFLIRLPLFPFIALQMLRKNATVASVTLLLICVSGLNIIWGYPWTGMFSVCVALLLVGGVVNRLLRPILRLDFSLPRSVAVGETCRIVTHASNVGHFPAFDVSIGFQPSNPLFVRNARRWFDTSRGSFFEWIGRKRSVSADSFVQFHERGIHSVPKVHVATTFPFHLFHSSFKQQADATIAVTPAPLTHSDDNDAQLLMNAVGSWTQRLLMGDELQYLGSREYQPGMPVRRWDFQSWARLGRPIVREFQAPSVQSVTIIVDTACDGSSEALAVVERVLRLAATAITDLSGKSVSVRLYVTCETTEEFEDSVTRHGGLETESMLIRLAAAETLPTRVADQRLADIANVNGAVPTLFLTSRGSAPSLDAMRGQWECVCVSRPDDYKADHASTQRRVDRQHRQSMPDPSPVAQGALKK